MKVGEMAPDFTLKDQNDQEVRLSNFRGKKNVVLAFYVGAFSGVCTKENQCFTEDWNQFNQVGAEVLGISVDSGWVLKAWAQTLGLKHRLLSDLKREVSTAYGLFLPEKGFANRATVIVNKEGKVAWVKVQPTLTTQREDKEILAVLRELK